MALALDDNDSASFLTKSERLGRILGAGTLYYGVPGFFDAIGRDWQDPTQAALKVLGGAAVGVVMKGLLPAKGVVRGIAGTVMLGAMIWDLKNPVQDAYETAWTTGDDSAIARGIATLRASCRQFHLGFLTWHRRWFGRGKGFWSRSRQGLGPARYAAFENAKENFYEKRSGTIGQFVEPLSERAESMFDQIKMSWSTEKACAPS